ncbi:YtxH domain-containing protein [Aciduricibacillus chroicocephali]|uniref:YtxH domain-containing protein n=1 Tax=Aciduricibacillus chroicocephali TaxID=3054939 RepID=A0ABY9KXP5_9BACI|nr:YtxH domain-containing protein [Bacillaceae bacterium 44XB]
MANRKLMTRMLIGAVVGGLTALSDSSVRAYAKDKLNQVKLGATICMREPSASIGLARQAFRDFADNVDKQAGNVMNAVEQIEGTVASITSSGRQEPPRIEAVK